MRELLTARARVENCLLIESLEGWGLVFDHSLHPSSISCLFSQVMFANKAHFKAYTKVI